MASVATTGKGPPPRYASYVLHKLPSCFSIEEQKGNFPFTYNKIENWGLVKKNPPDFSFYFNKHKDDAKTIAAKKHWYETYKCNQPYFSFNHDAMLYCQMDVHVLVLAITRFLAQSFTFQDLLVKRYGPSPCLKPGTMKYFHLFTHNTTIGSYRYVKRGGEAYEAYRGGGPLPVVATDATTVSVQYMVPTNRRL